MHHAYRATAKTPLPPLRKRGLDHHYILLVVVIFFRQHPNFHLVFGSRALIIGNGECKNQINNTAGSGRPKYGNGSIRVG